MNDRQNVGQGVAVSAQPYSNLPVVALYIGLVALLFHPLVGIPAVMLAVVAYGRASERGEPVWPAAAAFVFGAAGVALAAALLCLPGLADALGGYSLAEAAHWPWASHYAWTESWPKIGS